MWPFSRKKPAPTEAELHVAKIYEPEERALANDAAMLKTDKCPFCRQSGTLDRDRTMMTITCTNCGEGWQTDRHLTPTKKMGIYDRRQRANYEQRQQRALQAGAERNARAVR